MNQRIANYIAKWCLGEECSPKDDRFQIVSYGILLTIESVYKSIILIILGAMSGTLWESIAFLIAFCGLRINAGGFHMKSSLGCTMGAIICWVVSLVFSRIHMKSVYYALIFAFTFFVVLLRAPASTPNNPIVDRYTRARKKIIALLYIVAVTVIAYSVLDANIRNVVVWSMAVEAITLLPKMKGATENEA